MINDPADLKKRDRQRVCPGNRVLWRAICCHLLLWCAGVPGLWAHAGCSDAKFLQAEKLYKQALSTKPEPDKIRLFEEAFRTCPSHGSHAQGYYSLGKIYYDRNEKAKAFEWLIEANRFPEALVGVSVKDLAQTNYLLGTLYREQGNQERSLIHLNISRALAGRRDKNLEDDLVANADALLSVMYAPETIKNTLIAEKSLDIAHRKSLNRVEVFFEYAKADLDAGSKERLDALGQALQAEGFKGCTVFVEGHTDETGTEKRNCSLGEQRARSVCDYLHERWGLPDVKLVPVSYGKFNPAVPREGRNRADWSTIDRLNRRVAVWNSGAPEPGEKDIRVESELKETPCSTKAK
ncbi:MAG: OmpA family protein [Thermodesulfobacteriota bacterium]